MGRGLPRKLFHDAIELREFFARESLPENSGELAALFRKKRQVALRPPNITRKDHLFPPL